MPHSATSSASGDEISTTVRWNSGVKAIHSNMSEYELILHELSEGCLKMGHN